MMRFRKWYRFISNFRDSADASRTLHAKESDPNKARIVGNVHFMTNLRNLSGAPSEIRRLASKTVVNFEATLVFFCVKPWLVLA